MSAQLLYFRLPEAPRFEAIHGAGITGVARADLTRRLAGLAGDLLRQHAVLSALSSPAFGTWLVPFEFRRLGIEASEAEQLETIAAAGVELSRAILEQELGDAVALNARFEVGTLPIESAAGDPADWLKRLDASPRPAPAPPAGEAAAEHAALLGLVARGIDMRLQSIVSLGSRRPVAYEALARGPVDGPWHAPDRLFEAAARRGLRAELELACLGSALALAPRLPPSCRLAVNLSPDLYGAPAVQKLAQEPELLGRLVFEITEHLPIPSPARLLAQAEPLRRGGAKLALDDAGCGYLNMELVRALKPDIVKLCITVTRRIGCGPEVLAAIRATVAAIRAEGAETLAEGVETETQARLALECGCTLAQGFLFAKARPIAEILAPG